MKEKFRLVDLIANVQEKTCSLLLVLMSAIVIMQVFSRYIFNHSFVWAEELVRYLMIWMVMIGSALVQSRNDHIRIDFFPILAGPRGRRVMETFFRLCTLVFLVIIAYKGVKVAYFNRLFESSGLRVSMLWPMVGIPLGATLIGGYTLVAVVRDVYRLLFWPSEKLKELDERIASQKYAPETTNNPKNPDQET